MRDTRFDAARGNRDMVKPPMRRAYPWPGDSSGQAMSRGGNAGNADHRDWHRRLGQDPTAEFRLGTKP
jgi:hypothetical protein